MYIYLRLELKKTIGFLQEKGGKKNVKNPFCKLSATKQFLNSSNKVVKDR